MRVDAVKAVLASHGLAEAYMEFAVSSATVDLAAAAVGCEPGRIAKSLSVMGANGPMVLVAMGTARLDNRKFKDVFGCKPRFIKPEDLPDMVGHPWAASAPLRCATLCACILTRASGILIPYTRRLVRPIIWCA